MNYELRPWRHEDAEDIAFYADNKKIASNMRDAFPYPYTLRDAREYVDSCIQNKNSGQLCYAVHADGHAVGSIGVFLCSDIYRYSAELGYWLAEDYWGQGIMSSAVNKVCREAFRTFPIVRIFAEPFARNIGSRTVLEHCGFLLEGIKKDSVCKNGELLDSCMYALLK
ncbi:GNAT family N-acetyltransferase [Anaerostipes sp.]|uniref:GNAT family N-acetyltransferase n=1 Tax=Anaerostipes sp. TaxID=1872530 RepID=UPI0025BF14B0|nr:GNAT family N-acetyltransferase [Anaerostipes sp.]MBS7006914.1 GNAT family N-acetyltransferase [Anaerostipes sp.]